MRNLVPLDLTTSLWCGYFLFCLFIFLFNAICTIHFLIVQINKPLKTTMTPQQLQQHQQTLLELQKELEDDETEMMSTLGLVRGSKPSPAGSKGKKANTNETDPLGTKEDETVL